MTNGEIKKSEIQYRKEEKDMYQFPKMPNGVLLQKGGAVGNGTKPPKIARNRLKKRTVTILLTYF